MVLEDRYIDGRPSLIAREGAILRRFLVIVHLPKFQIVEDTILC